MILAFSSLVHILCYIFRKELVSPDILYKPDKCRQALSKWLPTVHRMVSQSLHKVQTTDMNQRHPDATCDSLTEPDAIVPSMSTSACEQTICHSVSGIADCGDLGQAGEIPEITVSAATDCDAATQMQSNRDITASDVANTACDTNKTCSQDKSSESFSCTLANNEGVKYKGQGKKDLDVDSCMKMSPDSLGSSSCFLPSILPHVLLPDLPGALKSSISGLLTLCVEMSVHGSPGVYLDRDILDPMSSDRGLPDLFKNWDLKEPMTSQQDLAKCNVDKHHSAGSRKETHSLQDASLNRAESCEDSGAVQREMTLLIGCYWPWLHPGRLLSAVWGARPVLYRQQLWRLVMSALLCEYSATCILRPPIQEK